VAALGPQAARDLADYFATIPPRPANDGGRDLATSGRAIYMAGIPEANIASCYRGGRVLISS
jgi:orotidine-5'-phosphate decarboxylase